MRLEVHGRTLVLVREPSDPRMRASGYRGTALSHLMYHVRNALRGMGFDVIKTDLSRDDGNLLSDGCYGVRSRRNAYRIDRPNLVVSDPNYVLMYDAAACFNEKGRACLDFQIGEE